MRLVADLQKGREAMGGKGDPEVVMRSKLSRIVLARHFGIFCSGGPSYEVFGIAHGGGSFTEYLDLFLDPPVVVAPREPALKHRFAARWDLEIAKWFEADDSLKAMPFAIWDDLTVRQQRVYVAILNKVCREVGIPKCNRQSDSYYEQLLRLWDIYMGWTGRAYEPPPTAGKDRMTLERAAAKAGLKHGTGAENRQGGGLKGFYRVYEWVMGEKISESSWAKHFGDTHGLDWYCRRRRGRRAGRGVKVKARQLPTDLRGQESLAAPADDKVVRFFELVRGGMTVSQAIAELGYDFSEENRQKLERHFPQRNIP
jgi:hypothetical protein